MFAGFCLSPLTVPMFYPALSAKNTLWTSLCRISWFPVWAKPLEPHVRSFDLQRGVPGHQETRQRVTNHNVFLLVLGYVCVKVQTCVWELVCECLGGLFCRRSSQQKTNRNCWTDPDRSKTCPPWNPGKSLVQNWTTPKFFGAPRSWGPQF